MNVWRLSEESGGEVPAGAWGQQKPGWGGQRHRTHRTDWLSFPGSGQGSVVQWWALGTAYWELSCVPWCRPHPAVLPLGFAPTTAQGCIWESERTLEWASPSGRTQGAPRDLPSRQKYSFPAVAGARLRPLVCGERHLRVPLRVGVPRDHWRGWVHRLENASGRSGEGPAPWEPGSAALSSVSSVVGWSCSRRDRACSVVLQLQALVEAAREGHAEDLPRSPQ